MSLPASIVWLRHDLRLADNPALDAAVGVGGPVVPVFIWEPDEEYPWEPGSASRWWLHHALQALAAQYVEMGSKLVLRAGPASKTLRSIVNETKAGAVFWNRRYEPAVIARDAEVERSLIEAGVRVESFNGSLLTEPGEVHSKQNSPYKVFTPYWNACKDREFESPIPAPASLAAPPKWPKSTALDDLGLLPTIDWAAGTRNAWVPGEAGATARLASFLDGHLDDYAEDRDRPDHEGTARLSPHLHFGEISPRTIRHSIRALPSGNAGADTFRKELAWRDFSYQVLFHAPQMPDRPLRPEFENFPWRDSSDDLRAWQRGRTGYPIVDAGMRQLWTTGWMHNRVRMIVASFLVKHLLLPWQAGARWFWDTLVDADLANNSLNWQWSAGCGTDAAPYFRVFNPVLQGEKFDPCGDYVRRWLPALAEVPAKFIHKPWVAPTDLLRRHGVTLGTNYPHPIVEHAAARERALEAFRSLFRGEEA